MWKIIKSIWGFVMTIIGIGGFRNDLENWSKWFRLDSLSSDFWWSCLIVIGIALLVANLIPSKVWLQLYRRLPLVIRGKIRLVNVGTDKLTGFYTTRRSLASKYGGIDYELENSDVVWACWTSGTIVAHSPEALLRKVKRLLLRNPDNVELNKYAKIAGWGDPTEVISNIRFGERVFSKAGTEVRWYDAPFTHSITIGDPDSRNAWARVEIQFYGRSEVWQNYLVYRRDNKVAFDNIKSVFEKMWESEWSKKTEIGA